MLVAGAAGFQESAMATASVLAIAVGLIAAVPTIITGLVDLSAFPLPRPRAPLVSGT
jgi:ABC-type phosphate transport system permease subunit